MEPHNKAPLTTYRDPAPLAATTRYCELCNLPNHPAKTLCDGCDHELGTPVNWDALRAELPRRLRDAEIGVALVVAMLVINFLVFQGAGAIVAVAPCAWALWGGYRYWLVRKLLAHAPREVGPLVDSADQAAPHSVEQRTQPGSHVS